LNVKRALRKRGLDKYMTLVEEQVSLRPCYKLLRPCYKRLRACYKLLRPCYKLLRPCYKLLRPCYGALKALLWSALGPATVLLRPWDAGALEVSGAGRSTAYTSSLRPHPPVA
jgi:hypothetical protein